MQSHVHIKDNKYEKFGLVRYVLANDDVTNNFEAPI